MRALLWALGKEACDSVLSSAVAQGKCLINASYLLFVHTLLCGRFEKESQD